MVPRWWEKTVEYLYLSSKIEQGFNIVLPFAGPLERAFGDALTIEAELFQIIEFKHNVSPTCLGTESKKYGDGHTHFRNFFDSLSRELHKHHYDCNDLPHTFVCGADIDGAFGLKYLSYWNADNYGSNPVKPGKFHIYAKCLASVRRPSANGAVSGGLVVGIDTLSKRMVLIELDQLLHALRKEMPLNFEPPQPPNHSSQPSYTR